MARKMTIRGVPDEIAERLERLSREREQSVSVTTLEILEQALSVDERRRHLERYATWTPVDHAEFEESLRAQRPAQSESLPPLPVFSHVRPAPGVDFDDTSALWELE